MNDEKCKCGGIITLKETPKLTHYGKMECSKCSKWISWVKNPDKVGRTKTSKIKISQILEFHNYKNEFCFFCLRTKEELGDKQTMTIDHIQELQQGGEDDIKNLQILCTACHKLKNWMRLYNNWHYK